MKQIFLLLIKNKYIFLTLLILNNISTSAQFFTELNCGYSFPIYNKSIDNNFYNLCTIVNNNYSTSTKSDNKFNIGNGLKLNFGIGYKLKKNINFSIIFSYLNNNSIRVNNEGFANEYYLSSFYIDSVQQMFTVINKYQYFYGKLIKLSPNFSYVYNIGNFSTELGFGVSISNIIIFNSCNTYSYRYFDDENGDTLTLRDNSIFKYKYSKKYFLKPFLSIFFNYKISGNMEIRIGLNYNKLIVTPDKKTQYYSEIKYSTSDSPVIDNTIQNKQLQNERFNLSSIDFSFGIRYFFKHSTK